MTKTQISEFVKDPESMRLFQQERVILDVTERICEAMAQKDMNRVQLAAALGKSKGYISQLLDGSANMTLRTMSDVFLALGLTACVRTQPLYSCEGPCMTFAHDEPVIWDWQRRWGAESPPEIPVVSNDEAVAA